MNAWLGFAVGAAVLYGLHQIFTKLASASASDGLGGFIVETSAAGTIGIYLLLLYVTRRWEQHADARGFLYSVATGLCVGVGTIFFFQMFQRGGPLSAVPLVLAVGSAIMAAAGVVVFNEPVTMRHLLGVGMSLVAILLLKG
jgi:bacterial/archaeal transporter family protein